MTDFLSPETLLWDQLFTDVSSKLRPGKRYCAVRSIRGSNFQVNQGIAVIGRAPNGWVSTFSKEEVDDPNTKVELVHRVLHEPVCPIHEGTDSKSQCKPMHWLQHPFRYKGATRVNTRLGRFWPTVEDILKRELGDSRKTEWEESVAWTNLYLVSEESGNPGAKLMKAQRTACAGLLYSALRTWKPRVALFITEVNSPEENARVVRAILRDVGYYRPAT